MSKAWLTLLHR